MCIFCGDDSKGLSHWGWGSFENFASASAASTEASSSGAAAAPVTSAFEQEVAYVTGVNADGTIQNNSWWGLRSDTAHKWGTPTAGTGATISFTFDTASAFTDTEKDTFLTALDMWSAIANVTFVIGDSNADVKLQRGGSGSGANEDGPSTQGSGSTLGQSSGQHIINMETGRVGWDLSGRVDYIGGFGMATIIHEVGHLLGLGHGGNYNGTVNPATQQFSAYDELMWTTMSYIGFSQRSTAAFRDSYDYKDTNWGSDNNDLPGPNNSYTRTAHTWMPLDVVAIQRLYGEAESTPLDGGDVFGFNTSIGGRLQRFFDFTNNTTPVVTLFSTGADNTLDLSGFSQASKVNLDDGSFSSAAGLVNNIGIAFGTVVETAITGDGNDTINGNDSDNMFDGGAGADTIDGKAGSDTVTYQRSNAGVDVDLGRQNTHPSTGGHAQGDFLVSIENLTGSNHDDRLVGVTGVGGNELEGRNGNDIIFGSADNDTIRGGLGNDQIYGNEGNDRLYGADTNLIINGGFEVVAPPIIDANGYSNYLPDLEGWTLLSGPGRELFTSAVVGAAPSEGKYGIDLEGRTVGTNVSITQKVDRAEDGVSYRIAFEARKLDAATDARLEVYWGGTKLAWLESHQYVDPTTGYLTYYIDVTGGAGEGTDKNRLTFIEIGGADGNGTLLDNVRMYRAEHGTPKADDQDPSNDGSDTFVPGTGSDVVFGHGGDDRATFNDIGGGNDHFDGGSGIDTLVMDWHTATTSILYRGLNVSNSSEIGMTESYERTPNVVGDAYQYLYFKEVERFELTGGSAGDTLRGGELNDILIGNGGDDVLAGGGGVDILNGGDGFDRASLKLSGGNNTIRLTDVMGSGSITLSNGTQLISIESISLEAGDGNDYLDVRGTIVNPANNPYQTYTPTYFAGFGGNDTLAVDLATSFGATFEGGAGDRDLLIMDWSASQRDIYRQADEPNIYRTYSHTVTSVYEGVPSTVHYYYTMTFNNVERFELTGGTGNDVLAGGALDDVLKTIGGRDTLTAGAGDDILVVDWSQIDRSLWTYDSIGNGGVPLTGSLAAGYSGIYFGDDWRYHNRVDFSGIERFDIKSANRDDGIRTGDGDDIVSSAGGNDHILSGKGIDVVDGGTGNDRWEADKSFATAAQAINIDLNQMGVQLTYLGGATVRGIEMLTLKTGAAADTILTLATVVSDTGIHGFNDQIETNGGNDAVTVTGGRDTVAMGDDIDTLTVDWSLIGRSMGTLNAAGAGDSVLTGSLETGYSGIYFGDDWRYHNRVDFSGVEHFIVRTGAGNDGIRTGDGNDTVISGAGGDHIRTGKGIDIIDGGTGDDRWEADKSFATASQAINIDLNQTGVQLTYLGSATVRGIEMLTLKTGAGNDTVKTLATVVSNTGTYGYDDQIETNAGNDAVTVTGGRDLVAMGADTDTLTVDWSLIGRSIGTLNAVGASGVVLTGSLETGYSGIYFGDDWRYHNRVDFSGVEHFIVRGGSGNDGIRTGDGNDTVTSGDGNDHLITGKGVDVIDGGAGVDRWEADKSFATSAQAINIDLNKTGVQLTYLNNTTVRGIEMLTLQTGAGNDTIKTLATVTADPGRYGYDDRIETNDGDDAVTVTGGYDTVAMGAGDDTLTVDWSLIGRHVGTLNAVGASGVVLTGSLETGYSGIYYGDDWRYFNRVDFSGVEHFIIRGGSGNDGIRTGDGNDTVVSGDGNDHLITGKGIDVIDGGAGADRWEADKSFATASQAIDIDLTKTGVQLTYLGNATARGIEMLTLKTGAGGDTIRTVGTVTSNTGTYGYDDQIDTADGDDAVIVTGGRDTVAMGAGTDTLTVNWSLIDRSMGASDLSGSLETGYSGAFFGDDSRYFNRVDFSGVEHFNVRTGAGNDGIRTGDGNDTVISGDGNDHLNTGKGVDTIDGGLGEDRWEADKSFAAASQAINIDLNLAGLQLTYLGGATVRGIEMLTLKTGAGNDTVLTVGTVAANLGTHGYDDRIETNAGNDAVTVTGGRDVVAMGDGIDTLTVDWSLINRTFGSGGPFTGSLETGYSGAVFGDDSRYFNRVDFSGVEHFVLRAGGANDTLIGAGGNDVLKGGGGNDVLDGGAGIDTADYSDKTTSVAVALNGAVAASVTVGGVAEDTVRNIENLIGGSGDDVLTGDSLANRLEGGAGDDVLKGGGDADVLDGGIGIDTADYSDKTTSVTVTLNGAAATSVKVNGVVEDTVRNIENLIGGTGDDVLTGDSLANRLEGGAGDDILTGGGGKDVLDGGAGIDTADYSDKTTSVVIALSGATPVSVKVNGVTEDTISNIENLIGGAGDDTLTGDRNANFFRGGLGADVLNGGAGIDTADYSDKTASVIVTLNDATATDVTVGGIVEDSIRNIENVIGGSGNDVLTGDSLANRLEGGAGDDILTGGGGKDVLDGGIGIDTADYSDKTASVAVTLNGAAATSVKVNGVVEDTLSNIENLIGGSGNDVLTGDSLANRLEGGAGDDILTGGGGKDVLDGGTGIDTADYSDKTTSVVVVLSGATSVSVKVNGVNEDTIRNIENLIGGSGNDTLTGDQNANFFRGGLGADVLNGGAGIDTADYSDKAESVAVTLNGATASSVMVGGLVEDSIRNIENVIGGAGNDVLAGDSLVNRLEGGAGNDVLRGGGGADVLDGGTGIDTADYSDRTNSVVATLAGATPVVVTVKGVAEDTLSNIENLIGGSGNDVLTGDSLANRLEGGAGDDILTGGGGKDVLDGGAGIDTADYSDKTTSVAVALSGATPVSVKVNGVAEDTISNIENLIGGSGNDTLTGDQNANFFRGGLGADVLNGGAGIDTADYSDKTASVAVTLNAATATDVTVAGIVEDSIRNIENLIGGSGNDVLMGDSQANRLEGGTGDDLLRGGGGADVLDGGAGIDTADYGDRANSVVVTLAGGAQSVVKVKGINEDTIRNIESLIGGSGNDTFTGDGLANRLAGGAGDDMLKGGGGADVLDGGAGIDTANYADKTASVVVALTGAAVASVTVDGVIEDTISNIENLIGGSGDDVLTGDSLANRLEGGAGDDVLTGGGGKDVLDGGAGIDTASYSDKTASIVVTLNGATTAVVKVNGVTEDTIRNIENVTGGFGNDVLTGDSMGNRLEGGAGNDVLKGGGGADVLHGGAGADTFVFNTALQPSAVDAILDFTTGIDRIALDDAIFTAFAGQSMVGSAAFHIGGAAQDADDHLIYDSASGTLMYDADGTGAGTAQAFAILSAGLSLTEHDFLIV
jgi:Ca2+-binding RTX toxin-like protein